MTLIAPLSTLPLLGNTRVRRRMTDSSRHKRMRAAQTAAGKSGWPTSLQTEFNGTGTEFKGGMHDVDILGALPSVSSSPTTQPHHASRGKPGHTALLSAPASSALPMPFGVSGRKNLLGLESLTEAASQHSLHEPTANLNEERALGSSLPPPLRSRAAALICNHRFLGHLPTIS